MLRRPPSVPSRSSAARTDSSGGRRESGTFRVERLSSRHRFRTKRADRAQNRGGRQINRPEEKSIHSLKERPMPVYSFRFADSCVWLFVAGAAWAGLPACLLAWSGDGRPTRARGVDASHCLRAWRGLPGVASVRSLPSCLLAQVRQHRGEILRLSGEPQPRSTLSRQWRSSPTCGLLSRVSVF